MYIQRIKLKGSNKTITSPGYESETINTDIILPHILTPTNILQCTLAKLHFVPIDFFTLNFCKTRCSHFSYNVCPENVKFFGFTMSNLISSLHKIKMLFQQNPGSPTLSIHDIFPPHQSSSPV